MAEAANQNDKAIFHLVTFTPLGQAPVRFTNWDTNFEEGLVYTSLPKMEIAPAPNVGGFQDKASTITMMIEAATTDLLTPLASGLPFAPTQVKVEELIDPTRPGDSSSRDVVINGQIYRTRRNVGKERGKVIIEIKNAKDQLDVPLGFACNPFCAWRLNGPGCNESSHSPSGYVFRDATASLDGKILRVTDNILNLDLPGSRSWSKGYVSRGGVNIGIRYYDKAQDGQAAKSFQLVQQPPAEWEGQVVTFRPGCTKSVDGPGGCRDAWANEGGFSGMAIATPGYNPITENPQGQ